VPLEQVIEELIELAKQMREAQRRGEELGLSPAELAFYDALEANNSAVQVLGDDTLRTIAHELVDTIRKNVTIDWTLRENAQALLRVKVKRILKKFGYPPDMQKKATETNWSKLPSFVENLRRLDLDYLRLHRLKTAE
jgi:type I restriction enzyme, R subunit